MKKYLSQAAMVAVFFLIVSTSLAENYTATTDTVGFVTLNITTGTGSVRKSTLISAPLLDTASINGSVTGNITGVTVTTMTCSTANWTAGALSQAAAPYLIQITSGNATGHMFLISTTPAPTAVMALVVLLVSSVVCSLMTSMVIMASARISNVRIFALTRDSLSVSA
jgi:hypothetical protein